VSRPFPVTSGLIGPFGSLDPTDGGNTSRFSLSSRLSHTSDAGVTRLDAYAIRSSLNLTSAPTPRTRPNGPIGCAPSWASAAIGLRARQGSERRFTDMYRQRARMAMKILLGAKPADIPVEQPTRFELVINLQAAKAIGHEVPAGLVLRADKVIE
jgi:hypothetical protein